jgi:4-hydroxy-tetrahydrodipicolinate synthase
MEQSDIGGIVVPMVTPLHEDGRTICEAGVHQLVERFVTQGVHGVFVGGTTGEVWALDDEQWARLVRCAAEACQGRTPLYVGVSHPSTTGAVARARQAKQLGADVVVSLPPYYVPCSQDEVVRHFQALAAATSLPVLVYQFPGIAKVSITRPTYAKLASIPGVVGVKDSQADVTEFRRMVCSLRSDGHDFRLFLGSDALADVVVLLGAQGLVPSIGNIGASFLAEAWEAALAGQWERSAAAQARVEALRAVYYVSDILSPFNGLIGGLKCALSLLGVEAGPPAPPMLPLAARDRKAVAHILHTQGVLEG